MASANTARNFGLTSMDLISKGAALNDQAGNAAQRWANIANGTIMSPAGFVITPAQQAQMTLSNRLIGRQVQQEKNNVAAAPNPIAKGLSDLVAYLTATYVSAVAGKGGPAGQPPKAVDYSAETGGGGSFGGAGAGSTYGLSKDDTAAPGLTPGAGPVTDNSLGFSYGAGYPTSDPALYYGGASTTAGYPIGASNPNVYPWNQDIYGGTAFSMTQGI
jgi:hypothetical protein